MKPLMLALLMVATIHPAQGDSWAGPQPEGVFSADGSRFVRITPGSGDGARAEFYVRTADRSYRRLADVILKNPVAPVKTIVTNSGHLIAFDNWHNAGYGEVVAVYGPNGELLKSHRLEDMYDEDGLKAVPTSVSSRWWRCNPIGFVDPDKQTEIYFAEFRGGNFIVTVSSGLMRYEPGTATCNR